MKRLYRLAICVCVSVACFASAKEDAKTIYDADTRKVQSGDLNFDWRQYRIAAVQGGTSYLDWHPLRAQCIQQLDKGDVDAALKIANQIIDNNMAEPEGHLLALVIFRKMGRQQDAELQHKIVHAYLQSILDSGDGKSSKTAFFVVKVDEEYFYLNFVMDVGLPSSQSLVNVDGHSFDLLKVKDKDGRDREIWFNVDTDMNVMANALDRPKKN
jgi:hypothetical protein